MTQQNHTENTHYMIEGQIRPNAVNDEKILAAIASVNRVDYTPRHLKNVAFADQDIVLENNRIMPSALLLSRMLKMADAQKTDIALMIGDSTGYSSAVISRMVEAVVSLEDNEQCSDDCSKTLEEHSVDNVATLTGDMALGNKKQGPYDIIFINGGVEQLPQELIDQLSDNGRLVCVWNEGPVGHGRLIHKQGDMITSKDFFETSVPVIPCFALEKEFEF
mgnify:CR=1 FL=1